jgi:hypothetical protein
MFAKVFLTGIAVAALALAQGPGGGGGGGGGGRGGGGSDPNMGGGGCGRASYHKETQADQIANRLKAGQRSEDGGQLHLRSDDERCRAHHSAGSEVPSGSGQRAARRQERADIAPLNEALRDAEFQMTGVEVKAFQKVVALLKPNQMSKAPEAFDLMADIFLQAGRGRGGPGGR